MGRDVGSPPCARIKVIFGCKILRSQQSVKYRSAVEISALALEMPMKKHYAKFDDCTDHGLSKMGVNSRV